MVALGSVSIGAPTEGKAVDPSSVSASAHEEESNALTNRLRINNDRFTVHSYQCPVTCGYRIKKANANACVNCPVRSLADKEPSFADHNTPHAGRLRGEVTASLGSMPASRARFP